MNKLIVLVLILVLSSMSYANDINNDQDGAVAATSGDNSGYVNYIDFEQVGDNNSLINTQVSIGAFTLLVGSQDGIGNEAIIEQNAGSGYADADIFQRKDFNQIFVIQNAGTYAKLKATQNWGSGSHLIDITQNAGSGYADAVAKQHNSNQSLTSVQNASTYTKLLSGQYYESNIAIINQTSGSGFAKATNYQQRGCYANLNQNGLSDALIFNDQK